MRIEQLTVTFAWLATCAQSFIGSPRQRTRRYFNNVISRRHHSFRLYLSAEEERGIDDMRRLLEASWNTETMGPVPTNADDAAEAAVTAIGNAADKTSQLFFVDLLLPQYDVRQGTNLYDEVLAVEFCIGLANKLKGKTEILVRDDKTIKTVSRILDARETARDLVSDEDDEEDDEDNENDDDAEDEANPPLQEDGIEFYDDFADFGALGGDESTEPTVSSSDSDVDSFRQQLIAGWSDDDASESPSTPDKDVFIKSKAESPANDKKRETKTSIRRYRLASMLGSQEFSSGPDMQDQVVKAVRENALPKEDEETIIILSAVSCEEMIGVRALVSKYEGTKKIVLVNCSLQPIPRELMMAKTVYSIQPFIARPKVSEANVFGANPPAQGSPDQPPSSPSTPPKVVVVRRFPRDWEVFVDVGEGFELASTVPPGQVDKKGPSMQFISGCVKQFLQSKYS